MRRDFKQLTWQELSEELTALEERLSRTPTDRRVKNLFQNFRIQVQLEMQNRELRETHDALEELRNRYADLYDFAPIGYLILDVQGVVREINLTGASMLGRERAELVDRPLVPYLEPHDGKTFFNHLNKAFGDPVKATVELALRPHGGERPWVKLESVRVRSGDATVCRTAMIDVTERRQIEEQLRNVTDAVPALIAQVDRNLRYRFVNATYRHWFGLDPEKIIGRRVDEVISKETAAKALPFVERALQGEEVTFNNVITHHELGPRQMSTSLIPERDQNGNVKGYFAVAVDVTDRDQETESSGRA